MNNQPKISSEFKPCDGKDWDETEEIEVILTTETKSHKKVFKGVLAKGVGVNRIE